MADERHGAPAVLVGVGGWAYFPLKFGNKLEICSRLYDFAEVNSTFYKLPPLEQVKKWRSAVPEHFEFTVRATSQLTHQGHLEPTTKNFKIYEHQLDICRELDASVLHFQFPPSLEVTADIIRGWKEFMRSIWTKRKSKSHDLHFAFEIRNAKSANSPLVGSFFDEYDIIPSEDASRINKLGFSYGSKILYSRVFGLGEHTKWSFDTNELTSLAKKVKETPARKRYVTFHNITMYEDAARMKSVVESGNDQIPKGTSGLDSLKRAIALGRVKYPASKSSLLEEFAWRTFSIEPDKKIHVGEILQRLPDRQYESVDEIFEQISSAIHA
ncbi:MAG: DUF72 domain-containing protein [Nitrososphaerales archaeon]